MERIGSTGKAAHGAIENTSKAMIHAHRRDRLGGQAPAADRHEEASDERSENANQRASTGTRDESVIAESEFESNPLA
ncbi:MAG: hypothetical protein HYR85_15785 [Planctomycetes bacterium]|nr:hypothetical protein [Planctomycetota bacterium]MBI3848108.1 hypothetical protein [Planctomycetota bacterium]